MLLLTSTSDLVRVITSAAASIHVHASWVDNASGTITPDRTNTAAITTATTTTVVASPGASTQRNVRFLSVYNNGTADCDVTVIHSDGTNIETLIKVPLRPGELLISTRLGRWIHYDFTGTRY